LLAPFGPAIIVNSGLLFIILIEKEVFFYFFIFAHKPLAFRKPLKNLLQKYEESF